MRGWRARRGVAAVEFAILLPVLIAVLTSLADLTRATLTWWGVAQAADAVGRIATSLAVTDSNTNLLTQDQASIASTAALPFLPDLRGNVSSHAGVVLSSVVFTPTVFGCTRNCTYVANVAWSASLQGGLPPRSCGVLIQAANQARPSPTTLAASAFGATPILVVDVAAEYAPLVTGLLGSLLRASASGLMAARAGGPADWIRIAGPSSASLRCKGFS